MFKKSKRILSLILIAALLFSSCPEVLAIGIENISAADKVYETTEIAVRLDKQTKAVIEKIDAIGEVTYTDACLTRITSAENAYALLNAEQKKLVSNYDVLLSARATYNALAADNKDTSNYTIIDNGEINTVQWYVYDNGVLEITGTGAIPDYTSSVNAPWFSYANSVTEILVRSSITKIGALAFYGFNKVENISIPFVGASRTAIGVQSAFGYIFDYTYRTDISATVSTEIKVGDIYTVDSSGNYYVTNVSKQSDTKYNIGYYLYSISVPSTIKEVTITDATVIQGGAFANCNYISKITMTDKVTEIGDYAFYDMDALSNIVLSKSIDLLGEYAFYNAKKLNSIYLPNNIEVIFNYTFNGCTTLKTVKLPTLLKEIGACAFYETALTEVIVPDSVESIGSYAFAHKYDSYNSYSTTKLSLGNGLKTIGTYAFSNNAALKEVVVPDNVQTIGECAFIYCNYIEKMSLPFVGKSRTAKGIESSFGYIFDTSHKGSSSTTTSTKIEVGDIYDVSGSYNYYVSSVSKQSDTKYSISSTSYSISFPSTIKEVTITDATVIQGGAFANTKYITTINLNDDIESVGAMAFYNNTWYDNLTEEFAIIGKNVLLKYNGSNTDVVIPETVKYIAGSAFTDNTAITSIEIPDTLIGIGSLAFSGCKSLSEITVPKSVSYIGYNAIPSTCKMYVYKPSAGYDYRTTNIEILNDSFTTGNDTYYYVVKDDGKAEIIGCVTTSTEITVPNEINGYIVDKIGDYGFKNCTTLNSITIPNNILNIGEYAFWGCTGLVNATIPTTVNNVGNYAFKDCTGLVNVTISEGVETLGDGVFYNCISLLEAVVPDTAVSVGHSAFYNCTSMTTATIGISAVAINDYTFYNCNKLNTVVIGYSVESVGNYAFYNCDLSKVSVPSSVKYICDYAFAENTNMTRVTLRKNLLTIGEGSFQNDKLLSTISIPSTVTDIGIAAFENCESITSISIPTGVLILNDRVFNGCLVLADVEIESQLTSIGASAFCDCAFSEIILPETVETIKESAFRRCKNLIEIIIPDSTTFIGDAAFLDATELIKISIADSVQTIGKSALVNNNDLTVELRYYDGDVADSLFETQGICHIIIDENISTFGNNVFALCYDLSTITYNDNLVNDGDFLFSPAVISFGNKAFMDTTLLSNLIVPDTLQSIGTNAFYNKLISKYNCKNVNVTFYYVEGAVSADILKNQVIKSIFVNDNIHSIGNNAFASISTLDSVSLPDTISYCGTGVFTGSGTELVAYIRGVDGTVDASVYDAKTDGIISLTIDDSVQTIGSYAFANNPGLKVVVVNNATTISDYAFYNDIAINNLSLYGSLEHIGEHAFDSCKSIPDVVLPETVRYIGAYAFYDCNSMTSINIPIGVPSINNHTFYGCASLKAILLPDTVKSIGGYAFYGCVLIENLELGNAIKSIGEYAFYNCNQVSEINLPNTVETIGNYAFRSCSNITEIYIPDSVTSLGDCVFYGCTSLVNVEFGTGITIIGDRVFYACVALDKVTFNGEITEMHEMAFYGAEDATLCAFANEYVETYCDDNGLIYYNLADDFTFTLTLPNKVEYIEFEKLDTTGLALNITYGNGAERIVKTGFTVGGYDSTIIGQQTVSVTYNGKTETFNVNVTAKEIAEIIVKSGNGTIVIVGEEIDTSNIILNIVYTDGTNSNITTGYEIVNFDNQTIGSQDVSIKYRNIETVLNVVVNDYVKGDINGDGIVSMKDVTRIVNYLNDSNIAVIDAALDVNGDGIVSIKDVTRLVEYLENNTVEIH